MRLIIVYHSIVLTERTILLGDMNRVNGVSNGGETILSPIFTPNIFPFSSLISYIISRESFQITRSSQVFFSNYNILQNFKLNFFLTSFLTSTRDIYFQISSAKILGVQRAKFLRRGSRGINSLQGTRERIVLIPREIGRRDEKK